jgi:hypothetical protein
VGVDRIWLRSASYDVWLQGGALLGVAPALVLSATLGQAQMAAYLSLATLIAIPFLHVFASFFVGFSGRNASATSPSRLLRYALIWTVVVAGLHRVTPRGLATFALLYGGWHILRQNFGLLRELADRAGLRQDARLRRLDLVACLAPAVALWLWVSARGPWSFLGGDVYHLSLPAPVLWAALAAVGVTALARERHVRSLPGVGGSATAAGGLILGGNAVALLVPALLLNDLVLIYAVAASYHGFQYLAYVAERERERERHTAGHRTLPAARPDDPFDLQPLVPLSSAVVVMMMAWVSVLLLAGLLLGPERAEQVLLVAWYLIVPFHYFVDSRIWRRRRVRGSVDSSAPSADDQLGEATCRPSPGCM